MLTNALKQLRKEPRRTTAATYEMLGPLVDAASPKAETKNERFRESIRLRDTALILFGFAVGRRGAELAAITIEDIQHQDSGWIVKIPKSKTNRTGEPEIVGVPRFPNDPLCPIAAVEAWMLYADLRSGPIFRTISPIAGKGGGPMRRQDISRRLEAIATRAGLEGFWRSHSLRRGVVTSAEQRGVARSRTRILTGWKSDAMFAIYADHQDKIAQSPLHEIYSHNYGATTRPNGLD
jgi:integrase